MSVDLLDSPVDAILLAGKPSPGLCDIIGARRDYEYVVRQPPYATGARIVYKRAKLAEFEVRLRLYSTADLVALREWRNIVDKAPNPRSVANGIDIWHPLLEELGIKSVVVTSVSQLEQIDPGVWALSIRFLEYRGMPKQTLAKVEGTKDKPLSPFERQSKALQEEIARVNEELAR